MADIFDMNVDDSLAKLAEKAIEVDRDHLWLAFSINLTKRWLVDHVIGGLALERLEDGIGDLDLVEQFQTGLVLLIVVPLLALTGHLL